MNPKLRLYTGPNFKNLKNGKIYRVISYSATNCTNSNEGQELVIYTDNETGHIYVREKSEFLDKFQFVDFFDICKMTQEFCLEAIKNI